uniref:Nuclear receptor domain-containing protein n=1 Tax=Caenorhabditis tropicalis TaxID=1561998 RepID=A0A1I7TY57_9PELO
MSAEIPDRPNTCAICQQKAFGYNYDVVSCNACKMFFRRANTERIDEKCKRGGTCFDGDDLLITRPRCRACRYRKCKRLGMRHPKSTDSSEDEPSPKNSMVVWRPIVTEAHIHSNVLEGMRHLNRTRVHVYSMINVIEDPSFIDLVVDGSRLGIYMRPKPIVWEDTERKLKPWGSLGVLLVVEIIKTMDVYKELLWSDRVILLKNVAFKSHHLCIAFDSYIAKKGRVLAPTGGEMFPSVLFDIPECRDVIMDLLTTPMKPLQDLKLTENEFLLLNMIVICNPALAGLSLHGQEVLSNCQRESSRLLLQICMNNDPKNGPARFASILAIDHYLTRQRSVTKRVVVSLRQNWAPNFFFSKVLTESFSNNQ